MNLLVDPLLRVGTDQELVRMSLPALLAALGRDEVHYLAGIQRHQADAFHVFLCYLAGAILARRSESDPVQDEAYWREGLRLLAGDAGDDAWTLVVDDLTRPAFMQPPLPAADGEKLTPSAFTPDALDLLPTAKNHDLKQARASRPEIDEWLYALISLQTMSGYFGRGHPGIARMNGGFGNRSVVELVHGHSVGDRWRAAVVRLLDHRRAVLAEPYGYDPGGLVLVWLEPWDGTSGLSLSRLDPFFVEICRRVRLQGGATIARADVVPSQANRIAAKELKGVVGDAWLPVDLGTAGNQGSPEEKALTVSPQGLTAEVMRRLVFADRLKMTPLQKPLPAWRGQVSLAVSVLVRGQGTTEGFHERRVAIPPSVQPRLFGPPPDRDPLVDLSRSGIEVAGKMQNRVLKPAVFIYLEGAPEKLQFSRDSAQSWWTHCARRFEALWSADYFPWLWSVPERFNELTVLKEWAVGLRRHALTVLRETEQTMPAHVGRQYRTRVQAERVFWGALYQKDNFPFLKEERYERSAGS